MEKAGTVLPMGSLAVVVENLLQLGIGGGTPCDRPSTQRNRVHEFTVGERDDGGFGERPSRTNEFSANPGNQFSSFTHESAFSVNHPSNVGWQLLSHKTRTDSVARVMPV